MQDKDVLLAKWLSGEITDEQLARTEGREALEDLKRVAQTMDSLSMLSYDTAKGLKEFKATHQTRPTKIKRINWPVISGIAASAAILIVAWFSFFNTKNTIHTAQDGENVHIVLEDGSQVWLNDGSQIEYSSKDWASQRFITLTGEALFEVTKGSPFVVTTLHGSVEVLGTQFNARAWGDHLEVECYQGRVQVSIDNQETVLTANESVRSLDGKLLARQVIADTEPAWQKETSRFSNEKLTFVWQELERQFDIKIAFKDTDRIFTGTFQHNDLDAALNSVCKPLELNYTLSTDRKSVVIE